MSGPKINAAAMRRHRAEVLQRRAASPDPLPAEFLTWLQTIYQPEGPLRAHWPQLLSFVVAALTASRIRGEASLHKYVTHLTYFGGWLLLQGVSLELSSGLVRAQVDEYCRVGMPGNTQKSRSDRRSRLRGIADQVNPDQAPTPTKSIPRPAIKAPHSASEMANICRCAGLQPTVELTRQMCLCVSVGAGAGIDSSELKLLLGSHVVDLDDQGIRIDIPGDRTRSVWVLREYEDLLRRGLVGRSPLRPLLGRKQDRRNVAADVYSRAKLYGDLPALEQSRLRTTWLATLLSRPVPLAVIFTAAGLRSTRTLFDLLPYLPAPTSAQQEAALLRDGGLR